LEIIFVVYLVTVIGNYFCCLSCTMKVYKLKETIIVFSCYLNNFKGHLICIVHLQNAS